MPHFKCLACKTSLRSKESEADPIGNLCPVCGSLLEPVGDVGEIVGYRGIETRGSTSHRGASVAGQLISGRVGEIIARRELRRAPTTTAAPPRVPRVLQAFDDERHRRERRRQTKVRSSASVRLARREMGSTPSHEDDATSERGDQASITIDVFLVGKPGTDMSQFERRGLDAKPTRCQ